MGLVKSMKDLYRQEAYKSRPSDISRKIQVIEQYKQGTIQFNDWDVTNAIDEGYKGNPVVYACIDTIATNVSSIPVKIFRRKIVGREEVQEPVLDGALYELLKQPNEHMGWGEFIEAIATSLNIAGKAPVYKIYVRGVPKELTLLRADAVYPKLNSYGLDSYFYTLDGRTNNIIDKNKIMYIKYIDPDNLYEGLSPMMAASKQIDTFNEMTSWSYNAIQNKVGSNIIFHINEPIDTQEEFNEKEKMINDHYQGSVNAGKPIIISGANDVKSIGLKAQELEFVESMKLNREFICGVYGVDSTLIGDKAASTRDNYNTAKEMLWHDTIIPTMDHIIEVLNREVVRYFGDDLFIEADYTDIPALIPFLKDKKDLEKKDLEMIQLKTQIYKNLVDSGVDSKRAMKVAGIVI